MKRIDKGKEPLYSDISSNLSNSTNPLNPPKKAKDENFMEKFLSLGYKEDDYINVFVYIKENKEDQIEEIEDIKLKSYIRIINRLWVISVKVNDVDKLKQLDYIVKCPDILYKPFSF